MIKMIVWICLFKSVYLYCSTQTALNPYSLFQGLKGQVINRLDQEIDRMKAVLSELEIDGTEKRYRDTFDQICQLILCISTVYQDDIPLQQAIIKEITVMSTPVWQKGQQKFRFNLFKHSRSKAIYQETYKYVLPSAFDKVYNLMQTALRDSHSSKLKYVGFVQVCQNCINALRVETDLSPETIVKITELEENMRLLLKQKLNIRNMSEFYFLVSLDPENTNFCNAWILAEMNKIIDQLSGVDHPSFIKFIHWLLRLYGESQNLLHKLGQNKKCVFTGILLQSLMDYFLNKILDRFDSVDERVLHDFRNKYKSKREQYQCLRLIKTCASNLGYDVGDKIEKFRAQNIWTPP